MKGSCVLEPDPPRERAFFGGGEWRPIEKFHELCKTAEPIEMPFVTKTREGTTYMYMYTYMGPYLHAWEGALLRVVDQSCREE